MKREILLAAACCSLIGGSLVWADDVRSDMKPGVDKDAIHQADQKAMPMRVSKLIGMNIYNRDNQKIGDVDDIVIDGGHNKIAYVVVSHGGFLGMGDKLFAVPYRAFEHRPVDEGKLVLNISKDTLKNEKGFDKNNWPDVADPQFRHNVDTLYPNSSDTDSNDLKNNMKSDANRAMDKAGATADRAADQVRSDTAHADAAVGNRTGTSASAGTGTGTASGTGTSTGAGATAGAGNGPTGVGQDSTIPGSKDATARADNTTGNTGANAGGIGNGPTGISQDSTTAGRVGNGDMDKNAGVAGDKTASSSQGPTEKGLSWSRRYSAISGANVNSPSDEKLGDINDLVFDVRDGSISYAVLSYGGWLGINDKLFAIPFKELQSKPDQKVFVLNVSKDQLKNAPGFDKNTWPDFADPTIRSNIDTYYKHDDTRARAD